MEQPLLEVVTLEPQAPARASVIWLHGLGADGNDFVPIVSELGLSAELGVRFIFPHAPVRAVTLNAGMQMRAWFDLHGLTLDDAVDEVGIHASQAAVEALVDGEVAAGIDHSHIVLAGFSQGGAIALHTGLRHARRLAGVLALSTWLPMADRLGEEAAPANRDVPVMMAHGTRDPVVDPRYGQMSAEHLRRLDYPVEWHTYPMEHQVCMEEIRDIGKWLARVLGT